MFVKILVLGKDKNGNYPVVENNTYEVDECKLTSGEIDEIPHINISLFNKGKLIFANLWYPKWQVNIYLMNESGKTIDSYEWNGCIPPEVK